jgi:hypothetical protein
MNDRLNDKKSQSIKLQDGPYASKEKSEGRILVSVFSDDVSDVKVSNWCQLTCIGEASMRH